MLGATGGPGPDFLELSTLLMTTCTVFLSQQIQTDDRNTDKKGAGEGFGTGQTVHLCPEEERALGRRHRLHFCLGVRVCVWFRLNVAAMSSPGFHSSLPNTAGMVLQHLAWRKVLNSGQGTRQGSRQKRIKFAPKPVQCWAVLLPAKAFSLVLLNLDSDTISIKWLCGCSLLMLFAAVWLASGSVPTLRLLPWPQSVAEAAARTTSQNPRC